jgi:hypothetical protein
MHEAFHTFTDNLHPKFEALMAQTPVKDGVLRPEFKGSGVYLFSERGQSLYVGRTRDVRKRFGQHTRVSSGHNGAPFAFKLARHATGIVKSDYKPGDTSRAGLLLNADFSRAFAEAIERVRRMEFRFVEEVDPTRQCLLEVYVSVVCGSPYNDFSTTWTRKCCMRDAKDSATGISSHITSRFDQVDVILLVDTAKTPMLDGPTSVVRAVAASGHHDKLAIAFTSFDLLKRQANLPTPANQRAHVMATVNQALASLRDVVGAPVIRSISRDIDDRSFMLGYLDRPITDKNPGPAAELMRLLDRFEKVGLANLSSVQVKPVYDLARLLFSIQGAVAQFHSRWDAILRLGGAPNVRRAHWAEVKALNRRVALRIDNCEYGDLMPVADLVARLSEWITRYLDTPLRWDGKQPSEEEAEAALGLVQREVYKRLAPLAQQRLIEAGYGRWSRAFNLSGRGSTFDRARAVQSVYVEHVPVPGPALDHRSTDLLREMQTLVREAIEAAGRYPYWGGARIICPFARVAINQWSAIGPAFRGATLHTKWICGV